ncbi:MAG: dihydropteroate synthase [Pseudomonadota bacterium]|nr:dihydropteroate synthase [Pseudomonadota bacterium]
MRTLVRPTGFVDSPFGHDGKVARLAGGMCWFASVELIHADGARQLVAVNGIEDRFNDAMAADWARVIAPRAPLQMGTRTIRLDQPQVMGIVNATPDSFSDGGAYPDSHAAAEAGARMAGQGAAIIDVGGESTRPGAMTVWEGDEIERVLPIVQQLAAGGTAVSIDTRKSGVMSAAIGAGAALVNDVSGLTWDPQSAAVVAAAGVPVVLMHHQGDPQSMQDAPRYDDVLVEVYHWLEERVIAAEAAGISRAKILVDPGIGFGKTVAHNLELINGLGLFHGLGCGLVVGASRKRMIGALAGEAPADQRLAGSLALALKSVDQGAQIIRVHDVPDTVQALRVWRGLRDAALTPRV